MWRPRQLQSEERISLPGRKAATASTVAFGVQSSPQRPGRGAGRQRIPPQPRQPSSRPSRFSQASMAPDLSGRTPPSDCQALGGCGFQRGHAAPQQRMHRCLQRRQVRGVPRGRQHRPVHLRGSIVAQAGQGPLHASVSSHFDCNH
eukprot:1354208-Pyramimonas_sp.AAC.1